MVTQEFIVALAKLRMFGRLRKSYPAAAFGDAGAPAKSSCCVSCCRCCGWSNPSSTLTGVWLIFFLRGFSSRSKFQLYSCPKGFRPLSSSSLRRRLASPLLKACSGAAAGKPDAGVWVTVGNEAGPKLDRIKQVDSARMPCRCSETHSTWESAISEFAVMPPGDSQKSSAKCATFSFSMLRSIFFPEQWQCWGFRSKDRSDIYFYAANIFLLAKDVDSPRESVFSLSLSPTVHTLLDWGLPYAGKASTKRPSPGCTPFTFTWRPHLSPVWSAIVWVACAALFTGVAAFPGCFPLLRLPLSWWSCSGQHRLLFW